MSNDSTRPSRHPQLDDRSMWTVFAFPDDFPRSYVARRFSVRSGRPTRDILVAPTLDALRELVQAGVDYQLHSIERDPADNPAIVETWL